MRPDIPHAWSPTSCSPTFSASNLPAATAPGIEAHGLRLDGDAALALDLHGVEHLLLHLARAQAPGELDQPVGQGRFPMIDMGDDREIPDVGEVGHGGAVLTKRMASFNEAAAAPKTGNLRPEGEEASRIREQWPCQRADRKS